MIVRALFIFILGITSLTIFFACEDDVAPPTCVTIHTPDSTAVITTNEQSGMFRVSWDDQKSFLEVE